MRVLAFLVAVLAAPALVAQEAPKKPQKAATKKKPKAGARGKPTPEQIRKFNELQKKHKQS